MGATLFIIGFFFFNFLVVIANSAQSPTPGPWASKIWHLAIVALGDFVGAPILPPKGGC